MTGEDELTIFAAGPGDRSSVHVMSISSRRIVRSVVLPAVARFVAAARPVSDGNILALFYTLNVFPLLPHVGAVLVDADGRALIETRVREFSIITPEPDREGLGFIGMLKDATLSEIRLVRVVSDSDSIRTEDLGVLARPDSSREELTTLPHHYLAKGADGQLWTVGTDDMSIRVIPPPDFAPFELSGAGIASSYGTAYVAHIWSDASRVFLRRLSCEP